MKRSFVVHGVALAAGAGLVMTGVSACNVPASTPKKTTFQMYANVDAEGDLGSNFDATKATFSLLDDDFVVTFTQPIGHCAASAQPGKAGGPDPVGLVESTVVPAGAKSFLVAFSSPAGIGHSAQPFMLTVTCSH